MLVYVDIDQTICKTSGTDYTKAEPIYERIKVVNNLYKKGDRVVYWTARGSVTGIDWYDITKKQLESWDAKHHELKMGKPPFDIFIDDKSFNSEIFFNDLI